MSKKNDIIKIKKKIDFTKYIITFLFIKSILCQIDDHFYGDILESEGSSILDVADYLNLSLLVSSSGKIYNGTPLSKRSETSANLNSSSMVAICNENYILAACLDDYLLVKININNGNFEKLIEYSEFN